MNASSFRSTTIAVLALVGLGGVFGSGCSGQGERVLGEAPGLTSVTLMEARLSRNTDGVTVSGIMIEKCPEAGCWFVLKDSTGRIKVDTKMAGFVVVEGSQTLLIRGPGPALQTFFNVRGLLEDPQLRIFRGSTLLAENDDWSKASNATQIEAVAAQVGAFAMQAGGRDPALVVTLPPGAYTAQVSGVGATTGVALVEVYEVR